MKQWCCCAVFIVELSTIKYTVSATKPNVFLSNTKNSVVTSQYENKYWLGAFCVVIAALINFLQPLSSCLFHEILLIDISDSPVSSSKDSFS